MKYQITINEEQLQVLKSAAWDYQLFRAKENSDEHNTIEHLTKAFSRLEIEKESVDFYESLGHKGKGKLMIDCCKKEPRAK